MSETVNQVNEPTAEPERTFTQAEMNAIIRDRVNREKEKYADYETLKEKAGKYDAAEEAAKSDLEKETERANALQQQLNELLRKDTLRQVREKVAQETGVPADLLFGDSEEACKAQAEGILKFARPQGYPSVKDGGEVVKPGSGASTSQQFADWLNESLK